MIAIAIANQKGGVGKTTTAINLAAGLALKGHRTMLVDADPQSNATISFVNRDEVKGTIYGLFEKPPAQVVNLVTSTRITLLDLLACSLTAARVEQIAGIEPLLKLKDALDAPGVDYEFVIIDCPPSLGQLTMMSLVASRYLIIPVRADYYSLEGTADLMDTYKSIRRVNPELRLLGVVVTQYDQRNNICKDSLASVQESFGDLVFKTTIGVSVRLQEAPAQKHPIFQHAPDSKGGQNYRDLVEEVLSRATRK